jgi:hypothetical protein
VAEYTMPEEYPYNIFRFRNVGQINVGSGYDSYTFLNIRIGGEGASKYDLAFYPYQKKWQL